jgi:hypothetical protein
MRALSIIVIVLAVAGTVWFVALRDKPVDAKMFLHGLYD